MSAQTRILLVAMAVSCSLLAGLPGPAAAQFGPSGTPFQVNTYTTADQVQPVIAAAPDGKFVVVWRDRISTNIETLVGARFAADGSPLGTEFVIAPQAASYRSASVGVRSDGAFVVVWEEHVSGTDADIRGRRYSTAGNPIGTEFRVNSYTTGAQRDPEVSYNANGGFIVVWESEVAVGDSDGSSIHARRYTAAGAAIGAQFQVNTYTTYDQGDVNVATDPTGAYIIVWRSDENPNQVQGGKVLRTRGQRLANDGTPVGTELQVGSFTTSFQGRPDVAVHGDGSFVVVWDDRDDTFATGGTVFAQRFDALATPLGPEFPVAQPGGPLQDHPAIAIDALNEVLIVWETDAGEARGQLFDGAGSAIGTEFTMSEFSSSLFRSRPKAAAGGGQWITTWSSMGSNGSDTDLSSVQAQLFHDSTPTTTTTSTTSTTLPPLPCLSQFVEFCPDSNDCAPGFSCQVALGGLDCACLPALATTTTTSTTSTTTTTTSTSTSTTSSTMPDGVCGDPIDPPASSGFTARAVTATDALFALQTGVGSQNCRLCECDVNDSGEVTATDALLILQAGVGQPVVLNCPPCN